MPQRSTSRAAALRAVKHLSSVADRIAPPSRGIVVLIYHRVGGGSGSEVDLDPGAFAAQLAAIRHRAMRLDDALAALEHDAPDGPDPVVVTFDDGTADVVEHALPALVQAGVPATLYLATSFVDEQRQLPYGGRPLSWAALADARSTGFLDIGSHTHSHALLDRLDVARATDELDRSRELIEDHLGVPALDFAYPKAVTPPRPVEDLVRSRFRSAALSGSRSNPYGATDPWRLNRSPVQAADGLRWFEAKAGGGMRLEDALRRRLNRLRYRGADT